MPVSSPSPSSRRSRRCSPRSCAPTSIRAPPARTSSTPRWCCKWRTPLRSSPPIWSPSSTVCRPWRSKHARTPCVGRTYGQHAAPMTFGCVAGTWLSGIVDVAAELPALRERTLVASLGGPVGTLTSLGEAAEKVGERFAAELGLGIAPVSWHTNRTGMVAVGRVAGDARRRACPHGNRRGLPVRDRDRRGARGTGRGPRWLVGHAAQAEPPLLRRDPLGPRRGTGPRRDASQRRQFRPAAPRPACGRPNGMPCPHSSASPPARFAKPAVWRQACMSIRSACAPIST